MNMFLSPVEITAVSAGVHEDSKKYLAPGYVPVPGLRYRWFSFDTNYCTHKAPAMVLECREYRVLSETRCTETIVGLYRDFAGEIITGNSRRQYKNSVRKFAHIDPKAALYSMLRRRQRRSAKLRTEVMQEEATVKAITDAIAADSAAFERFKTEFDTGMRYPPPEDYGSGGYDY